MPSSNSGRQGLSQAAAPAAAAPNPALAQNGGGPKTKHAAGPGRTGAILVSQFGPVKIHSYLSPADGLQVNTQMIEGPNAIVIFDTQLLLPYADEVASYVQTIHKPVDRIIVSHAHTDHWGGLQVLTERFPNARVFALDGIADQIRNRGPARLDGLRRTYGDRAPTKVTAPTETITEGPQRIDGVTYDFRRFIDTESDLELAVLLPEQKVLMAFDLVFSPKQHAFTGANQFDHWLTVLESLKALQGYDRIIIGHDTPVDRLAIESTMTYVKRAKEIHAASADAKTYSENLKAAFPNLQLARFVDLSASYLYPAPPSDASTPGSSQQSEGKLPPGHSWLEIIKRPTPEAFAAAFTKDVVLDASVLPRSITGTADVGAFFGATRVMFDAIAFTHEVTVGSRTYLEWEGTFQGNNIDGLTVLTKDAAGLIESIRVYYRPYNVVVAFSADLAGRLVGNMIVDPFLGSTLRRHP